MLWFPNARIHENSREGIEMCNANKAHHFLHACFAGDEDDSVHSELEEERDGSLAGNLRHWSRYVHPFLKWIHALITASVLRCDLQ